MNQAFRSMFRRLLFTSLIAFISLPSGKTSFADEATPPKSLQVGGAKYQVAAEGEDRQFDYNFKLTRPHPQSNAELLVGYQDPANYYRILITARIAEMFRVVNGRETRLLASTGQFEPATVLQIIVRRRASMFYVQVNGISSIEVMDSTFSTGLIALKEGTGAVSNDRYQPIDNIKFFDDFMRTEQQQELGVWENVRGLWRFHSVRETNPSADFRRSVNPFSLGGHAAAAAINVSNKTAPDIAMVTTGHPYWVDYEFLASVKSSGAVAGVAFNYQNEKDYYLVRWDMTSPFRRSSRLELVKVKPSGRSVLAEGYATCGTDQWYRLGVRTMGRRMQVLLDGDVIFDVVDREAIGGKVGLYVEGTRETYFDDVQVETNSRYVFDRRDTWQRNGAPHGGRWDFQLNAASSIVGASGPHFLIVESNAPSHYYLGDPTWQNQIVDMKFKEGSGRGWVGIEFGAKDPNNYSAVRWASRKIAGAQPLELVRVVNGSEHVLAVASEGFVPRDWHTLQVDLSEADHVRAYADGVMKIRVKAAGFERGTCGVYAADANGSVIDNVTVAFEKDQGKEKVEQNEIFRTDPFMLLWSAEKGDWFPVKGMTNAYWHKGDFHGPFALTLPPTPDTRVNFASANQDFAQGYELSLTTESQGKSKLVLKRQGAVVAQEVFAANTGSAFKLHHEDEFLWVDLGDKEVLTYHDPKVLRGTHVGLRLATASDLEKVKLERYHVRDYLFDAAPADWVRTGTWEVTNRFSCTPTWSHMSALDDQDAILSNKYPLEGDFTIEFYAGMRMQSTRPLVYPRTGDINLSFCADGKDVSSGYSYLVGAWDAGWTGKWTELLRGTEVVTKTDRYLIPRVREGSGGRQIEVPYIAEGRPIHGAWYYIKVRKLGNRIECYFDNELVLTYEDKKPLRGKYFAIWSQDQQIVVARVKIAYEHIDTPARLRKTPAPLRIPLETNPYVTVSSPTHPGLDFDFSNSLEGWKSTNIEHGALLEVEETNGHPGKRCLKLTNVNSGGDFGVKAPIPYGLDLLKIGELSFNYRTPREARVNLYFKIRGKDHFVEFTGESASPELLPKIGKIEGVQQDNQWHHANFNLGAALRQWYPKETSLMLDDLVIGNEHEGYLRAGFGGNLEGTTYYLSDFRLIAADPHPPTLQWSVRNQGTTPVNVDAYAYQIDRKPDTDPGGGVTTSETRKEFQNLAPGKWYFHVKGRIGENRWTEPMHFAFYVDSNSFAIGGVEPQANSRWGGGPVAVKLQSGVNVYPLAAGTSLTVNGKTVSELDRCLTYDYSKDTVTIDLSHTPLSFSDGQKVELSLHLVKSGGQAADHSWSYIADWSKEESSPTPVRLANYPLSDFDEGTGTFHSADTSSAIVENDPTDGVSGKGSLKVVNARLGSNMPVIAWDTPFSAGRYPILSFDYRIPQEVHADVMLGTPGATTHLVFADTDTGAVYQTLGTIEGVARDDHWRHAETNLHRILERQPFNRKMLELSSISFGDYGYAGVAPGSGYHLDNFQLVPVVNGKRGVPLEWQSNSFSGIKGYSAKWSRNPADTPESTLNVPGNSQTFTVNEEGIQYLHIRAQDNAGKWSEIEHYRFIVSNSPPVIGKTIPAANEKFASSKLILPIRDNDLAGIDPESLAVSVNGKDYPLDEFVTQLDEQNHNIIWEWALVSGFSDQPVADGAAVKFTLKPVKDFAGNQTEAVSWTAKINYASDKEPPLAPEVKSPTQERLSFDTFIRNVGEWLDWGSRRSDDLNRYFDPEKKDYVIRLVSGGAGRRGSGAYVRRTPYDVTKYPFISFEYKFTRASVLQLLCSIAGQWRAIQLTGPSRRFPMLGAVPNINQDGNWHVVTFSLYDILRQHFPNQPNLSVDSLAIGEEGSAGEYFFDNFAIFGPGKPVPQFQWTAFDPTGIKAFSYTLDQNPETMPDATPKGNEREKTFPQLSPGIWYLHLRAQDGAGNWSAPVHYPYFVGG